MSELHGVNLTVVKAHNEAVIINLIRRKAPISRYELAELSGLTPATISAIVNRLILQGILGETGTAPSRGGSLGGRRRRYVELVPDSRVGIGLLVSRSGCVGCVVDISGRVHAVLGGSFGDTLAELSEEYLSQQLERELGGLIRYADGHKMTVMGIGIGVPTWYPPHLDWQRMVDSIAPYSIPVTFSNNAVAAALGEWWYGGGEVPLPSLYAFVGGGIGGALITQGGAAGVPDFQPIELGHLGVSVSGEECYCGGRGCLENFVLNSSHSPEMAMDAVAYALRSLTHLFNVRTVTVGGPESHMFHNIDLLRARLQQLHRPEPVTVEPSRIAPEHQALGAGALVFQTILARRISSLPAL